MQKITEHELSPDDMISLVYPLPFYYLYPSIDIEEMTNICNEKIKKVNSDYNIKTTLQRARNLVLRENYFEFNNYIYKQRKGVPMGSPISNIVAK